MRFFFFNLKKQRLYRIQCTHSLEQKKEKRNRGGKCSNINLTASRQLALVSVFKRHFDTTRSVKKATEQSRGYVRKKKKKIVMFILRLFLIGGLLAS